MLGFLIRARPINQTSKRQINKFINMCNMRALMSNSKGLLQLGLIEHLNKTKKNL